MKKIWPSEVSELSLKFKQNKIAQKIKFKFQNGAQWARAEKHPPKAPRSTGLSTWSSQVDRAVDRAVDLVQTQVEPSPPWLAYSMLVDFLWSALSLGLGGRL